jgi:inward rectifier potassium channel
VRSRSPLFALTWTVLHVIDETSPLYGVTEAAMKKSAGQILVVLSGMDETFAQRIHARHSYMPADIAWNKHFADVISENEDGGRTIDYGLFHDLEDLPMPDLGPEVQASDQSLGTD